MNGVVGTRAGLLRGRDDTGVWCFAGVRYARAPVGSLRWRRPQGPEPWAGVRDAGPFGAVAPQVPPRVDVALEGAPATQDEDCLFLNVWTPGLDGRRRPVMVWLHGGGFTSGSGSSPLYRGHELARAGDVVVVTLNYRLGALGFLAHPALAEPDDSRTFGNFGLLDQLAALRWVGDEIGAFGGDPDNVTVFGESAGAMSLAALLAVPEASGLFHRAILQSGPPYTHSPDEAAEAADRLAGALELPGIDRRRLEALPAGQLVDATQVLASRPRPGLLPIPFLPVVDGQWLPTAPLAAVRAGQSAGVELIAGTNRHELAFFALGNAHLRNLDQDGLVTWVARARPMYASEEVIERYRSVRAARGDDVSPRALWVAIGTDLLFRGPTRELVEAQALNQARTFEYLFTWESPAFGGILGSCHALEIPFVFGSLRQPQVALFAGDSPAARSLSSRMQRAWTDFARSGNPSASAPEPWPSWDLIEPRTRTFGATDSVEGRLGAHELAVWTNGVSGAASIAPDDPSRADPGRPAEMER